MYTEKQIGELIDTRTDAVEKAIHTLWMHQTADEQNGRHTNELNGVGFNRMDAASGCFYGKFIDDCLRGTKGYTPRAYGDVLRQPWSSDGSKLRNPELGFAVQCPEYRLAKCRKIARKYVRQLTRIANAKLVETPIGNVVNV